MQDDVAATRPSTAAQYHGTEASLEALHDIWLAQQPFDGILGPPSSVHDVMHVTRTCKMQASRQHVHLPGSIFIRLRPAN